MQRFMEGVRLRFAKGSLRVFLVVAVGSILVAPDAFACVCAGDPGSRCYQTMRCSSPATCIGGNHKLTVHRLRRSELTEARCPWLRSQMDALSQLIAAADERRVSAIRKTSERRSRLSGMTLGGAR